MVEQAQVIRKIVFLVHWPITQRETEKWGFKYLESQGFEVEVYDLSPFLNREALQKSPVTSAISSDFIKKFNSYQSLDIAVKEVASSAVFIDFIMGLGEIDLKTEKIYRIIKKHRATYIIISVGALPVPAFTDNTNKFLKKMINRAINALNPRILVNFILRKLIVFVRKSTDLYAKPEMIFSGNSEVLASYVFTHKIAKNRVVLIHSLDFDQYLTYTQSSRFSPDSVEGTCVFLDEAATHHSDLISLGLRLIDGEKYFPGMNRLFDVIEERTGLRVIIAAHPRSKYEIMPGVFGGRRIVKGKTIELVAKSSMVVTHASTSVSFAVLFKKPILFVKTDEMKCHRLFNTSINLMATTLGLQPLNVDSQEEMEHISLDYSKWPKDKYNDYKFKYIKSKDLSDLTVWEVVAREIHNLNCERKTASDRLQC